MIAAKEDHLEANPNEEETKEFKLPKKPRELTPEEKARQTAIRAKLSETIHKREEKIRPSKELYDQYGKSVVFFVTGAMMARMDEITSALESHPDKESWDTFAKEENPNYIPSKLSIEDIREIVSTHPELEKKRAMSVPNGVIMTSDGKRVGVNIRLKGYQGDRVQTMQFFDFFGTIHPGRELDL